MGHKFQDSTPKQVTWQVGDKDKVLQGYGWGYDSMLVTVSVDKGITGGKLTFEGFCGFTDLEQGKWGEWFRIGAYDVLDEKPYKEYDLPKGSQAFYCTIVGFSQSRVHLIDEVKGEGQVVVAIASHAANWR